jgi:transposase
MKRVARFCAHKNKRIFRNHRWRCQECGHEGRLPQEKTWQQHLRRSRKHLRKLVRYFVLGVPAYRLRFESPVSLKTIQHVYRIIREAIYQQSALELIRLAGVLEIDESSFGGKHPGKRGWGAQGKVLVFGIYQRDGKVLTFPVSSRATETLLPIIRDHTKPGSLYYTDDWRAYTSLSVRGDHVVVRKEKGHPKGRDHLNGIEGFWSYAKHWLYQYRGVPKHVFHLYLKELEYRFNHREENLVPLIMNILRRQCTN